jgi:hypothetical protein
MNKQLLFQPDNEIDNIIKENKLFRFTTEYAHTINPDRKNILEHIIRAFDTSNTISCTKNKLEQIYNKIDENCLKKKWGRLTDEQKKDRLKLYYNDDQDKYNMIVKLLEEKKLKQSCVEYDTISSKIISIKL